MLGSERTGFCFRKHGGQINSCSIYWIWSVYLYLSNSVFVNISQWSLPRGSDWKWKWKWRRRVQSQSWLCFVGVTVRSSLASSQRSPTRCHSTNSSLMPVWCVLNCVCVCECVCTPVQSWDTEEPVEFPGDTVSVMKKCGRKKEDDNKWVYSPETAIHLIAQEPAYEERLGKDDGGVCVCVCC